MEQGGHPSHLEPHLSDRFETFWADLTNYHLWVCGGPEGDLRHSGFVELPECVRLGRGLFDLVVLGGNHLRTNTSAASWDVDRLLISQLIIGLESVRLGGTIIMKLTHIERVSTAQILFMLDVLSSNVSTVKPRSQHVKRATFYAVAKGFGSEEQEGSLKQVILELKKLWYELTFGGEGGQGRFLGLTDLDFLITTEELRGGRDGYLNQLVTLSRNVCQVQIDGLNDLIARNNRGNSWRGRRQWGWNSNQKKIWKRL